jgi:putative oxidoreductase
MNNVILVIARVLIAHIFLLSGLSKLGGYAAAQSYMESMGTPSVLLPLVIALEIGGGLALIVGFFTRLVALALAGFCIVGAVIFHHNFADQTQMIMFMKDFAMAGGLLLLYVHGDGPFSIDAKRSSPNTF